MQIRQVLFDGIQLKESNSNYARRLEAVGADSIIDLLSDGCSLKDHITGTDGILDILGVPMAQLTTWILKQDADVQYRFSMAQKLNAAAKQEKLLDQCLTTLDDMDDAAAQFEDEEMHMARSKHKRAALNKKITLKNDQYERRLELMKHLTNTTMKQAALEQSAGALTLPQPVQGIASKAPPEVELNNEQAARLAKLQSGEE